MVTLIWLFVELRSVVRWEVGGEEDAFEDSG